MMDNVNVQMYKCVDLEVLFWDNFLDRFLIGWYRKPNNNF